MHIATQEGKDIVPAYTFRLVPQQTESQAFWCWTFNLIQHLQESLISLYHWSSLVYPTLPPGLNWMYRTPRSLRGARARLSQRIFVPGHFFQMPQETKPLAAENMLLNKWFCCMQRHDVARNDVMSPNWWFLHVFTLKMNLYFATASLISAFINQNPCFDL